MPQIQNSDAFGGVHWDSSALRNVLAFEGVTAPHTGNAASEALIFGICGGIGAGYSFCPSIPRWGTGSGVSVIGRSLLYRTDGGFIEQGCKNLGLNYGVSESATETGGYKNLLAVLESGKPAIAWCTRYNIPYMEYFTSCGDYMWSFVIVGVDADKGIVTVDDCAPTPMTFTLEELAASRGKTCSHKNRLLTLTAPKKIDFKKAVRAGLKQCINEMLDKPKMKLWSLPGFDEMAKMMVNAKNAKGWLKVFP